MKYEINTKGIERRIATGYRLPSTFTTFADECRRLPVGSLGYFAVKYTKPNDLLNFDPQGRVVPFLSLGDGGFVAFWFRTRTSPAVLHCDSEGQTSIAGASFSDFLLRLTRRKTSVPDLDERESSGPIVFKRLPKSVAPLAKLRKELNLWIESNRPENAATDDESEAIRKEFHKVLAKDMAAAIRESEELLGRKLAPNDAFLSTVDMIAHLTSRSYKVTTIGGGPFPRPERLRKVLQRLAAWRGHPLKSCKISVWSDGRVFVNRNVCLDPQC